MCIVYFIHKKGIFCGRKWFEIKFIHKKGIFCGQKKPPSGGPRSPCICVANTARAGAASLARALGNAKKEEQKVAAKPKQMQ